MTLISAQLQLSSPHHCHHHHHLAPHLLLPPQNSSRSRRALLIISYFLVLISFYYKSILIPIDRRQDVARSNHDHVRHLPFNALAPYTPTNSSAAWIIAKAVGMGTIRKDLSPVNSCLAANSSQLDKMASTDRRRQCHSHRQDARTSPVSRRTYEHGWKGS